MRLPAARVRPSPRSANCPSRPSGTPSGSGRAFPRDDRADRADDGDAGCRRPSTGRAGSTRRSTTASAPSPIAAAPLFPDCEPGAMPPFGQLYGMSAFVDSSLADEPELVFEGGTHREEIRMPMQEYLRVERPAIASVAAAPRAA
ncbi:MAG TPA: YbaK/EbsC family protein [Methylomirabilota bacterium]